MTKEDLHNSRILFMFECIDFLKMEKNITELKKFVLQKCEQYFPNCNEVFKNLAYDYIETISSCRYSRLDFEQVLKRYFINNRNK